MFLQNAVLMSLSLWQNHGHSRSIRWKTVKLLPETEIKWSIHTWPAKKLLILAKKEVDSWSRSIPCVASYLIIEGFFKIVKQH